MKINIILFHLGEEAQFFLICVAKTFPFLYVLCVFHTSQINLLCNHQYLFRNLEYSVNENVSVVHSLFLFEKLVFTFIIIKPKTKVCFSFSYIGSIITATLFNCNKIVKILKVWKFRITRCIKNISEFEKRKVLIKSLKNHSLK